jgi:hypothetical protein
MQPTTRLNTSLGQVVDYRWCEIPVPGPGTANTLVMITGIALSGETDNDLTLDVFENDVSRGNLSIYTNYWLKPGDQWKQIAPDPLDPNGALNTNLLEATIVSLCSVAQEDTDDISLLGTGPIGFTFGLDSVDTVVDEGENDRIRIDLSVGLQGDATLLRFSYQANILIHKADPITVSGKRTSLERRARVAVRP